jgi:AcrR family transcriptional regulator
VQLRREEILSATVRQIQRQGIPALRIADVAAALGVSPALVIYHFQTKENLVAEAFRHAAERDLLKLRRLVGGSGSAPSRLMSTLRWYAPTGRARGWVLWIDGWATALRDKTLAGVITDLDMQWNQAVADLIGEGVVEGDFVVEDAQEAAARITAMLDGLAVQTLVHGGGLARSRLLDWLTRQTAWELGTTPEVLLAATVD